jgi:hypothetical protein
LFWRKGGERGRGIQRADINVGGKGRGDLRGKNEEGLKDGNGRGGEGGSEREGYRE